MANPVIVNAYLARYTQQQIETALDKALKNFESGVVVTSLSFEGGASSGAVTGKTEEIIETLTACLQCLADGQSSVPERQAFVPVAFLAGG